MRFLCVYFTSYFPCPNAFYWCTLNFIYQQLIDNIQNYTLTGIINQNRSLALLRANEVIFLSSSCHLLRRFLVTMAFQCALRAAKHLLTYCLFFRAVFLYC